MFQFLKKKKVVPQFVYTQEQLDQYEQFIEEQFGEYEYVLHEITSPDIHLDVVVVAPNEYHTYYQLITMGMGAYKMKVPQELKEYELERAELIIRLPASWDIRSPEPEDFWPIGMMKTIGRLPIDCNTWLGYGHTISEDADDSAFASNTELCSMALLPGLNRDNEEMELRIRGLGKINFYQLFPLYKEELLFKEEHGMDALLDLFEDEDLDPRLNICRKNYAK